MCGPSGGACTARPAGACAGWNSTNTRLRAPTRYSSRAVTLPAPTYDLVLLLDAEADEQAHTRILGEAREAIEAEGELLRDDTWGDRALTYPIDHKTTARYHLLQFHATTPGLLERLDRSLRFADEVVRFRVIKLKPGTPAAPDVGTPGTPARAEEPAPAPAAEAAPEPEAAPELEAAAAPGTAPEPEAEAVQAVEAAPTPDPAP
jgi:small subunit ribosomal protein S6